MTNCRESLSKISNELVPEGIKSDTLPAHGAPLREIIEASRKHNIDLIVMATHGLGGLSHVLFLKYRRKSGKKITLPGPYRAAPETQI